MGLMMVRRVCEVDLKIWCRFYPVLRDEIGAFFVGGGGVHGFPWSLLYYDFFALVCAFFLIIAIEKYFL